MELGKLPTKGEQLSLVRFGSTGENCSKASGVKRVLSLSLTLVDSAALRFDHTEKHSCPGDSGGPAINKNGRVVGVASWGNQSNSSTYRPVASSAAWLRPFLAPDFRRMSGKVSLLRTNDRHNTWGRRPEALYSEVIVVLDSHRAWAFGFDLHAEDPQRMARRELYEMLLDAFLTGERVTLWGTFPKGHRNGILRRAQRTR